MMRSMPSIALSIAGATRTRIASDGELTRPQMCGRTLSARGVPSSGTRIFIPGTPFFFVLLWLLRQAQDAIDVVVDYYSVTDEPTGILRSWSLSSVMSPLKKVEMTDRVDDNPHFGAQE